ncbi:MAG TPA: hypothetical protein VFG04_26475 [Planctomycetaceae bacterium]|jgi:hypothetical protein|nr:hypothetical protein [Planctomycetaceae bacterium]
MRALKRRSVRIATCAAILAAYVSGYFALPHYGEIVPFGVCYRRFPVDGLNRPYAPLGWLERKIRGRTVSLGGPTPGDGIEFDPGELW